ncbi:MAG: DUF4398 domain-containing protein [Betaproteobacteria bacterium]
MRRLLLLAILFLPGLATAGPATARYAPVQLAVADAAIDRAERAMARGEAALARRLARQAALDARLTWAMTDSRYLRREAALILQRATRLEDDRWAGAGGR